MQSPDDLFRQLFKRAPTAMSYVADNGSIPAVNDLFTKELGYTEKDIPSIEDWWRLAYPDPDYRECAIKMWHEATVTNEKGEPEIAAREYRIARKDGSSGTYQISGGVIDGFLLASFVDVSDRVKAEEAIAVREQSLRLQNNALIELMQNGDLFSGDFSTAIQRITETCAAVSGLERICVWLYDADYKTFECEDLFFSKTKTHQKGEKAAVTPGIAPRIEAQRHGIPVVIADVHAELGAENVLLAYCDRNDIKSLLSVPVWMEGTVQAVLSFEATGTPRTWTDEDERFASTMASLLSLGYEISRRKAAQTDLEIREKALRTLIDAAPIAISIVRDRDGLLIEANRACIEMCGLSREALVDNSPDLIKSLIDPKDIAAMSEEVRRVGHIEGFAHDIHRPDGKRISTIASLIQIDYCGEPSTVSMLVDVTRIKQTEEELRRLNEELENRVVERTRELREAQEKILLTEKFSAIARLVAGMAHELNTPLAVLDATNRFILERFSGDSLEKIGKTVASLTAEERALALEAREMATGKQALQLTPGIDREARRKTTKRLRESGIADADAIVDDFIELGILPLLPRALPLLDRGTGDDFLRFLTAQVGTIRSTLISRDAVSKMAQTIAALQSYVREETAERPQPVDLTQELPALLQLFEHRQGIRITGEISGEAIAWGRREELNRIWFNLMNNAVQAIGDRGSVTVRAETGEDSIVVSIEDSGHGISEENRDRIFEPFFTTRPMGGGAGLGLNIVRRLTEANRGSVSFESKPGKTVFSVRIPRWRP